MMKLGLLSHLLVVLTPAAAQLGPFHSAVDDFGQMYYVTQTNPTNPVQLGPFQTGISSQSILAIPPSAQATHIIFAVSNDGRWSAYNPAMFILSSDPADPTDPTAGIENAIISDASWFCKGYGGTSGVTQPEWPKFANVQSLINAAMTNDVYKNWQKAVELSPNFFQWSWGTIESIPLEANFVWAAGLEPKNPLDPPRNMICVKSLP